MRWMIIVTTFLLSATDVVADPPAAADAPSNAQTSSPPPLAYPLRFTLNEPLIADELALQASTRKEILSITHRYMIEKAARRGDLDSKLVQLAAQGARQSQTARDELIKQFRLQESRELKQIDALLNDT
ncbi:MAG: hypothetical protein MI861_08470, partial [Pirellulales bacterium]|nr:hypothetical protein [Pirellulales bacterium]